MKKKLIAFACFTLVSSLSFAQGTKTPAAKPKVVTSAPAPAGPVLKNTIDSLSYSIGLNIASNIKSQNLKVQPDLIAKAIEHVLGNKPTLMETAAANACIQSYFQNESAKQGSANLKAGEKFLAENKTKAGVISLPSGLQYSVIKEGNGPKPAATDKVKVHYHGTLIDGTVFDSSVDRGQPIELGVSQVIQGWIEGLQLMPVGSKWKLYIPANLAYGPQGPPSIGPNQTLIFDVELLEIVK